MKEEKREEWKKKLERVDWLKLGLAICLAIFWLVVGMAVYKISTNADGLDYNRIEDTEDKKVIDITNQVAELYPICPELLQAMVFYESSNNMSAKNGSCIGYMQVSTKWHADRAKQLGVSIRDGYGNILTGTDYLYELCEKYGNVALALMVYHGESDAEEKEARGEISDYARKILHLSEKLEELHGKLSTESCNSTVPKEN